MENLVERRPFNFMSLFDGLEDFLNTGDPLLKEWFLVKSNFWPITLCFLYLFIVKVAGPAFMKDRKPYELRIPMIVYNLFIVASYSTCLFTIFNCIRHLDKSSLCINSPVTLHTYLYTLASCGWYIYLLKYIEFLDTIFFVLRKKDKMVSNLNVIHHFIVPLFCWIMFRTERSGFQTFIVIMNSMIHVVMYSYYALAALGPGVRKYLWWKRYLTIAQMIQFILIILSVTVIMPVFGCTSAKSSTFMNVAMNILFLALFYNFYQKSFHVKPKLK